MIKAYLCDTSAITYLTAKSIIEKAPALAGVFRLGADASNDCADKEKKSRDGEIEKSLGAAGGEALREGRFTESAAAYILLLSVWERLFGKEKMPAVLRGEAGKPYFDGADAPHFNLSHRAGLALLVISDEGEVGCDVEWMDDARLTSVARLVERLSLGGGAENGLDIGITTARLNIHGGLEILGEYASIDNDNLHIKEKTGLPTPWLAWCRLEAVLKLSGEGFGNLSKREELFASARVTSAAVFAFGEKIAISVAALSESE